MKLNAVLVGLSVTVCTIAASLPAQAITIEMQVFNAGDAQTVKCPTTVKLMQQPQPYREGGFTIDGSANLNWLADRFTVGAVDDFSVTWVGKLKSPYRQCKGTARMVKEDGEAQTGQSYLRLRFNGGNVYLILDMTGMSDANGLTPVILKKGVRNGNPFWSWGGTD